jgi:hypothetical protein
MLRSQALTAAIMKLIVFWDVAPYSLVEIVRRFRGAYCLHYQGEKYIAIESEINIGGKNHGF